MRRFFVSLLVLSLTVAAGCSKGSEPTAPPADNKQGGGTPAGPRPGGEFIVGLDFEPSDLDPAHTAQAVSHTVMMNIYDTLIWRDKDGKFVGGLAETWEAAPDGKSYTFNLRQGVKFHDGTPFNAAAVKFSFDRIVDPKTESGFAISLLGPYDHSEVVNDNTVKVFFKAPYAAFLDGASQAFLSIVSPAAVAKHGKDYGRNPVGTGFMKFEKWAEKEQISLSKNPDYKWGPKLFGHEGPAYLDKLSFRFLADGPTRLAALESGDVHAIELVPDNELTRIESEFQGMRATAPGLPIVEFLNSAKAPTNDLAVRQAMNYALNRKGLVDTGMFGASKPAYGPLWETTPFYSQAVASGYAFDEAKAKEVLEQAGWVAGPDGIRSKGGQRLTVTFAASDFEQRWVELIQANLKSVGIDVKITNMTNAAVFEVAGKGEYNMASLAWVSSDPGVLTNLFHSKNVASGFAWSKYKDAHLDELLEAGERTLDEAQRGQIYAEIQKIVMDQALIMPVAGFHQNTAVSKKFDGVKRDFRNYLWLYDAYVKG